tara:strand:+ start:291 stop:1427 length:1137 start_codon:yes stop_codon:yes gene_type:complete
MNKSIKIIISVTLVVLVLTVGKSKLEASDISEEISGILINSTNNQPVPMANITLYIEQLNTDLKVLNETTDSTGKFTFKNIEIKEDALYWLSVFYKGVGYTELFDFVSGNKNLELQVYDTTTSDDVISIFNSSILFSQVDHLNRKISVIEMVTLLNNSMLTYIPGSGPMELLRFGLPDGASNLIVDTEIPNSDWIQIDKGFAFLAPIVPGKHELMYAYQIPYSGTETQFIKNWRYGSEKLRIVIPENLTQVKTNLTKTSSVLQLGNINYEVQESKDIKRMQKMDVLVFNLPEPTIFELIKEKFKTAEYVYAAPITLALLLFISIPIFVWRNRKKENSTETQSVELIDQMKLNLKKELESGKISEERYKKMIRLLEINK